MSLSTTRERRKNGGSKMSSLLETEETDHFYDDIYGGFEEEENDTDYDSEETDSEDSVDSDFSIDENEDISDDQNEEESRPKTKIKPKYSLTPKPKPKQSKSKVNQKTTEERTTVPLEVDLPLMETIVSETISESFGKSFNSEILIENRQKFDQNMTELDPNHNFKYKTKPKVSAKEYTQKELLEEAVITEQINLKSLKDWEKLESERVEKTKVAKHSIKGPFIRYHSVSMPLIQEVNEKSTDKTSPTIGRNTEESHNSGAKRYSRTFISFSDDQSYASLLKSLSSGRSKTSKNKICAMTQMRARYLDPISQLPFANSQAFNEIRNQYYNNLEVYGNMDNEEVKQWIDWRLNISQKWTEWHKNHSPYDMSNSTEEDSQVLQSEPLLPKVNKTRKRSASRSGRKRKKY